MTELGWDVDLGPFVAVFAASWAIVLGVWWCARRVWPRRWKMSWTFGSVGLLGVGLLALAKVAPWIADEIEIMGTLLFVMGFVGFAVITDLIGGQPDTKLVEADDEATSDDGTHSRR